MWDGHAKQIVFARAVCPAPGIEMAKFYGQNLHRPMDVTRFSARVYDEPAVYEKSSPIKFIKNVKTQHSASSANTTAVPRAVPTEFWHARRKLNIQRSSHLSGEGSFVVKPEHQADRLGPNLAWFDKYLNKKKKNNLPLPQSSIAY